jgi:hypothetical protein
MLIPLAILDRILSGDVTLAFRRWIRPTVKSGGTLRTARGVLEIVAVERVEERLEQRALSADAARRAGFGSRDELLRALAGGRPGWLYRIELRPAGPDPRLALRAQRLTQTSARTQLATALARLDRAARGKAWTRRTLQQIDQHPGVRAADLAARLGLETALFKRRVCSLKELGLTESLEVGYRLSPRGRDALALAADGE